MLVFVLAAAVSLALASHDYPGRGASPREGGTVGFGVSASGVVGEVPATRRALSLHMSQTNPDPQTAEGDAWVTPDKAHGQQVATGFWKYDTFLSEADVDHLLQRMPAEWGPCKSSSTSVGSESWRSATRDLRPFKSCVDFPVGGDPVARALLDKVGKVWNVSLDGVQEFGLVRYSPGAPATPMHKDSWGDHELLDINFHVFLSNSPSAIHFPNASPAPLAIDAKKGRAITWLNVDADGFSLPSGAHSIEALPASHSESRIVLKVDLLLPEARKRSRNRRVGIALNSARETGTVPTDPMHCSQLFYPSAPADGMQLETGRRLAECPFWCDAQTCGQESCTGCLACAPARSVAGPARQFQFGASVPSETAAMVISAVPADPDVYSRRRSLSALDGAIRFHHSPS